MLMSGVLAIGLLYGAPLVELGLLAVGLWEPPIAGLLLGGMYVLQPAEPSSDGADAVFLAAIAGELRSGASLRSAVVDAAARVPAVDLRRTVRLAASGADMAEVAGELDRLSLGAPALLGPAVRLAAEHGGAAADTFERLALRSQQRMELDREIVVATTQIRLSMKLMVVLPAALLAVLLLTGHLGRLAAAGPFGRIATGAGVALQLAGVAAMAVLLRKAQP